MHLKPKAHIILDLNAMILPLALLKVTGVFRKMKEGEILEIHTEDQETREQIFKVLHSSRYDLVEVNEGESIARILLKKI